MVLRDILGAECGYLGLVAGDFAHLDSTRFHSYRMISASVCQDDGKEITTTLDFYAFVGAHGVMGL